MTRSLKLFISSSPDLTIEREALGQAVADQNLLRMSPHRRQVGLVVDAERDRSVGRTGALRRIGVKYSAHLPPALG